MECEALLQSTGGRTRPGCCSNRQYRLRCVHSKGVLLLMAWSFFWFAARFYSNNTAVNVMSDVLALNLNLEYAMLLVFPVVGWMADSCWGRYNIIIASVYIGILSWIFLGVGCAMIAYSVIPLLSTIILYSGVIVSFIGYAGFLSSLLPFVLDQQVGASGEELSAAVHWWYWITQLSYMLSTLTVTSTQFEWGPVLYLLANLLCLLFLVVTHLVLKDWLVREPLLNNPIKHIAKVLNYARKNKHPRNRSALTYWEEDYPSRLDLGKDKYGGPFSEEEVEDVKTVLRLLPLLVCMTASGFIKNANFFHHYTPTSLDYINTLISVDGFWSSIVFVVAIPFYQLVVYPCFYKSIPSMLRRMGTGLLLLALAQCGYLILELVGHSMDGSVGCVFSSDMSARTIPISIALTIIPQFFTSLGLMFLAVTSLEFVAAQSPTHMRAMMIGMWYAAYGFTSLVGLNLHRPFSHISSSSFTSCGFYYFLTKIVIIVLLFLLFLYLSKRYRLRERNIPVNFHMFAENFYDKYIDIERQLERERQAHIANSLEEY